MKPPPHVCTFCKYRADHIGTDPTTWFYKCPNCGTNGTEPRR